MRHKWYETGDDQKLADWYFSMRYAVSFIKGYSM